MKVVVTENHVTLRVSGNDTRMWAMRPNNVWPCSTLSGRGFTAEFDSNGLCDLDIQQSNGKTDLHISLDTFDIDGHELSAMCCDLLKNRLPSSHPAYLVAVDQFLEKEE
jgi:hypothetical protein